MLVIPRPHLAHLPDAATVDLEAVGRALRDASAALARLVGDTAYNLVVHTAPHGTTGPFHWHVHVLPRLTSAAAFEAATSVMVNVVAPEQAASELRCS